MLSLEGAPRSVKVLGVKFRVKYVDGLVNSKADALYGDCDGPGHTIRICTKLNKTPQACEATLMHEVIHAILYLTGQSELLSEDREEALVLSLENGLSKLYRRRP
ncbi:MAG: hypothetical protein H0U76_21695 [Ktedonobacteraceae bacterium]|nr:hypothetical protein [Ktedonobacteraceae bacterium]